MMLMVIVVAMLLVGFNFGVYIIGGAIVVLLAPSGSTTGIFGRLMPTVFTPKGWGNLGTTDPYLRGNR